MVGLHHPPINVEHGNESQEAPWRAPFLEARGTLLKNHAGVLSEGNRTAMWIEGQAKALAGRKWALGTGLRACR